MEQPPRPQAFRRPHHKSRLGCVQCKQRKIKCDETKPSCDKCTRYNTPCSFLALQATMPSLEVKPGTSPKNAQLPNSKTSSHSTPYSSSPSIPQTPSSFSLVGTPEGFTIMDLEFLHHYTISTCFTISHLHFWQTAVPSIAISYPFLMHGILAIGARHLAYLRPATRTPYITASDAHHHLALTGYRAALTAITQANCHACAAFSLLLNVYAWASPDRPGNLFLADLDGPAPPDSVELITILRGGNAVMRAAKHWVVEGPLGPLYRPWFGWNKDPEFSRLPTVQSLLSRPDDSPVLPHEDDARLERLAVLWAAPPPPPQEHTFPPALAPAARAVLDHTLFLLRRVFVVTVADNGIEPQAATLSWPIVIPDAYIEMVRQRNPQALVLLAHYCLLLKRVDERWWIEGKAEELLGKIARVLVASEQGAEWERWIEWPVREVGVVRRRSESGRAWGSMDGSMSESVVRSVCSQATTATGTPV